MRVKRYFIGWQCLPIAVTLFLPFVVHSQVCTGSLGDPVVNLTFGRGSTGPSSFVPTSSYTYTSSSCPNDGFYTVTNGMSDCFGGTWHNVSADHTGDGGNFMLVNASYDPGDFFLTTVTDLCPNTTYAFEAWIMNVVNRFTSIRPNLTFHIEKPDGTILSSFDTGDIPVTGTAQWMNYGILFTTPADNAAIVLRITNNAPGGNGNDVALDDITFRPCGAKITASIQGNTDTVDICEGNTSQYAFSGNASAVYQSPVYQWQTSTDSGTSWHNIPGATGTSYLRLPVISPGRYWYRFTVVDAAVAGITSCLIASNVLIINVHPKPTANAGPDRVYTKGYYPVTINAVASGEDISFTWSPTTYMDDGTKIDPTVVPLVNITYKLSVQSGFGCTNEDSMKVKVAEGLFIPSAFTPNGDGKNDLWRIPSLDIGLSAELNVYNRWGQLVYHTSSATVAWDGKCNGAPQASGVYIYVISFHGKFPQIKGTVTLIR